MGVYGEGIDLVHCRLKNVGVYHGRYGDWHASSDTRVLQLYDSEKFIPRPSPASVVLNPVCTAAHLYPGTGLLVCFLVVYGN